jgi:hypothetical protein
MRFPLGTPGSDDGGPVRTRLIIALSTLLAAAGCRGEPTSPSVPGTAPWPDRAMPSAAADSVVLIAAGDMHTNCTNPGHRSKATAAIVARFPEALVVALGDNAGQSGTSAEYECYDLSWGAFKSRTYPTVGNHELNLDPVATAHYDYFNGVGVDSGRAGHRGRGYYTLDYGGWRILVANSYRNIDDQTAWMARELAAGPSRCAMAIWHRPLFTSSAAPANVQAPGKVPRWWKVLYDGRADLILGGHVHSYERFAELRPDGVVDTARGIREFVVGTGGSGLYNFNAVPRVGSQKRLRTWGVLKLTLWPTRYKWQFIDLNGSVRDQGSDRCH